MLNIGDFVSLKKGMITIMKGEIVSINDDFIIVHPKNDSDYLAAKILRENKNTNILKSDRDSFNINNISINKLMDNGIQDISISENCIPDSVIHNWDFSEFNEEENVIDDFEEVENNKWYRVKTTYDGHETNISISEKSD